ncbi:hypothetical protein Back11_29070 [Paenibacillus baekrokdamisoli]|uniref:Uncharacterized protein n=1 Tax=Paenibacillus baekrokdamisoli TaxID=1712516 RepID=A0A3G9ITI3_9BACL|nr:sialate O-acetylesterase [Paenibacillus baekrokdamisoli]MBB3071143.1 hypothetical protein [Paenibacillus baekrokdamisoli]BBH21562.1 hypothetical protein Back11_29070 [Paenibacillus baekrokdamisoli]
MTVKPFGVQIIQGLQHWAILQQQQGFGTINLSGTWSSLTDVIADQACIYARVVKEDGSGAVIPWMRCAMGDADTWSMSMKGIPTGGLYRIETCLRLDEQQPMELATRGDMVHHLAVGDIWVIGGQSNATGYGRGAVYDPPEMGVHLLRHNGKWDLATHPFNESTQSVQMLNGEPVNPGHSPYLAFAKLIKSETGTPIGLLQTALGGSPLERWNPGEIGDLYRNMMDVIQSSGGKVKGMLWYQGCSDCDTLNAPTYYDRFASMVDHWRKDMENDELPVLTVQLNRYAGYADGEEGNRCWGKVREAQRLAAMQIKHVYVVPSLDSPLSDIIHNSPAGNLLIGGRLARAALAELYGKLVSHRAPNVIKAELGSRTSEGNQTVVLEFENVTGELFAIGPGESVFAIDDEKGLEAIAHWRIVNNNQVELILPRPIEGDAVVHGAYEANPTAFPILDTGTHMPMLAFYGVKII